ncbi:MAG: hypothetical protein ACRCZ2_02605 [Fusobacteriaceae bacterium]
MVRLKGIGHYLLNSALRNLHSTMVRLKVGFYNGTCASIQDLHSTMVRLKE